MLATAHRLAPRLSRRRALILPALGLAAVLLVPASTAHAQDVSCDNTGDFPCSFQIKDLRLQKVPPVFKFQARVSQAKLPLGEGLFNTVYVKLLRGTETLCSEQFQNVKVVDSVLNLEIGRNMSCELDEVMAENSDLAFQICPGDISNCLKPVELGSAPYAVKSSFASIAQTAHQANVAGQANYAHRITADRDLFIRSALGVGYFDFFTPAAAKAAELYPNASDFETYENGGFIEWTPVKDRDAMHLHIVGKRQDSDRLVELDTLHLVAEHTTATGDLTVTPSVGGTGLTVTAQGAHVTGASDIDGTLTVTQGTTVQSGGVHVTDDSNIDGALLVSRATTVQSGGVHVTGASDVVGTMLISQALTVQAGGFHVIGASELTGTLLVSAAATITAGGIHVTGDSEIGGTLDVGDAVTIDRGGLTVTAGGVRVGDGGLVVSAGGFDVTGNSKVGGRLQVQDLEATGNIRLVDQLGASHRIFAVQGVNMGVNPDNDFGETKMSGQVRFTGQVIFDGAVTNPAAAADFVNYTGEARDLTFGGDMTVLGQVQLNGGIIGGLDVSGAVVHHGVTTLPGGITGGLALAGGLVLSSGGATITGNTSVTGGLSATGNLSVIGTSTLTGAVSLPGGVSGNLATTGSVSVGTNASVLGNLSVIGTSTFSGATSFPGGIAGNMSFAGTLAVAGTATFAHAVVNAGLTVSGASSFGDAVTFGGGVTGNTNFVNSVTIGGTANVTGNANVTGGLSVDGATHLNGTVTFGGGFTGTTQFQSVQTTANLTVAGSATFNGSASFPGGVSTMTVDTAFASNGSATFGGPVNFQSTVSGLDNLSAYVKASGETRGLTLPSLVVTGTTTLQGTVNVATTFGNVTASTLTISNNATIQGNLAVQGNETVSGSLTASTINIQTCCICLNYGDNNGNEESSRKHLCARLQDGGNSGLINLSGDVNADDVLALKFVCGAACSNDASAGWK